jgi:sigma-E factor negative regulatory protein RseA
MKHQDENLSLLLDDDSEADVTAVLDEVMGDVNLQYRMRRYQIIGEALRNELPQAIDTDFHYGVMAKIRQQSPNFEAHEKHSDRVNDLSSDLGTVVPLLSRAWFRPFAGLAVAASVAVVTVALWQPLQQQGALPNDGLVSADQQKIEQLAGQQLVGSALPVSSRLQSGTRWKLEQDSPVLQRKLNAYLVNHTEYSSSMQGLIPQARVAGFDAEQ